MIRFPTTSHEWHMQNMEDMRRDQHSRKYPNDLATGHAGPLRLTRPLIELIPSSSCSRRRKAVED